MRNDINTVAILGGGPAGSALACHLLGQGREVVLFDDGAKPELIVGESLVPAVLPMLDRLGVTERVKAIGQHKPGVSFVVTPEETIKFNFQSVRRCNLPTYAYNVPRPAFDRVIAERAVELGAKRVNVRAKVEREDELGVKLVGEALAAAPLNGRQPDLIIDASGRSRLLARALDIPARVGPRKDVAYFAHYHGFAEEQPRGTVFITRLKSGWSWRIPLPDRLSVGVVLNRDEAATLGASAEERLEAAIARDPVLGPAGRERRRISRVMTYTNYQLVSEIGHGPGWIMAGDAFGFVDPMLSPGLMLALHSAEVLARNLEEPEKYAGIMRNWLAAWMELIEYFYDGQLFATYLTGMEIERKYPGRIARLMHDHIERHVACMACGASTLSNYSRGLLKFMARHGSWTAKPADLAIV